MCRWYRWLPVFCSSAAAILFFGCSNDVHDGSSNSDLLDTASTPDTVGDSDIVSDSDTDSASGEDADDGICTSMWNALTPDSPVPGDEVNSGSVTTYGSVSDPEYSNGGACNYGQTRIQYYAAIHLHVDLGGAPAADVMPLGPGRYQGEWEWSSCEGHPEVFDGAPSLFDDGAPSLFDGAPSLFVKDGANAFGSVIQVRNPFPRWW